MKKWWMKNREEVFAALFLLCLLVGAVGVVLHILDGQASRVRICSKK